MMKRCWVPTVVVAAAVTGVMDAAAGDGLELVKGSTEPLVCVTRRRPALTRV